MTDFDHELIAALAEGTLPADEAADLETRIAADPAASAELEAQRVALAAIAAATPPRLDDLERRRLHRSVASELDLVLPEPGAARRRRWSVNWSALATAAAVLLGVALAAPLLSLLNTSGSSDSATTITVADAADDVAAAQAEPPAETVPAPAALEEAAGSPVTEAPAATTAPADTTMLAGTVADAADGDDTFAQYGDLIDFGPLDEGLTRATARLEEGGERFERSVGDAGAEPPPCVDAVRSLVIGGGADATIAVELLGFGTINDLPVYVLAVLEEDIVRRLTAVDTGDCAEISTVVVE